MLEVEGHSGYFHEDLLNSFSCEIHRSDFQIGKLISEGRAPNRIFYLCLGKGGRHSESDRERRKGSEG